MEEDFLSRIVRTVKNTWKQKELFHRYFKKFLVFSNIIPNKENISSFLTTFCHYRDSISTSSAMNGITAHNDNLTQLSINSK
jgi:hypothetical protein